MFWIHGKWGEKLKVNRNGVGREGKRETCVGWGHHRVRRERREAMGGDAMGSGGQREATEGGCKRRPTEGGGIKVFFGCFVSTEIQNNSSPSYIYFLPSPVFNAASHC